MDYDNKMNNYVNTYSQIPSNSKLTILLMRKSSQPCCFRGVRWLSPDYKANWKAWMTEPLFDETRQRIWKQEKGIIFIDKCPAHPKYVLYKLKFIKLTFLPLNMTSKLQPFDQSVIQNVKMHFRRIF